MTQLERDELLERIVRKRFPKAKKFSSKLGQEKFTIIGGKSVAETVVADRQFEVNINAQLDKELR